MRNEDQPGILHNIIPQYDETALFAMSLTCALLLIAAIFSGNLDIHIVPERDADPRIIAAAFVFLSGLLLSMYHAFTDRPKTSLEKSFMLFFAVLLNSFSGIMAGMYDLASASGWWIIFPLLNIINGVVLLFMFRMGILSEANIIDQHASRSQFVITAAVVLILFAVCHYMFSMIWMQTLSVCVAYATNLGRSVPLLILGERSKSYTA
jgi:hypothetical protein